MAQVGGLSENLLRSICSLSAAMESDAGSPVAAVGSSEAREGMLELEFVGPSFLFNTFLLCLPQLSRLGQQ